MDPKRILLFTGGGVHDSKGCGEVLNEILTSNELFNTTWIHDDMSALSANALAPYDVLVLYYTRGELTDSQKSALLSYTSSGKGFVGVHSATASFKDCPEFHAMLGGTFVTHPKPRPYQVSIVDDQHPITHGITEFMVQDEQYIMDYDPRVEILATALWKGRAEPVLWTTCWGKGRVVYFALGHTPEDCRHEVFAPILCRSVVWAAG